MLISKNCLDRINLYAIYTYTLTLYEFLSCIKTSWKLWKTTSSKSSAVHHSIRETDLHNSAGVSAENMLIFSCTTGISHYWWEASDSQWKYGLLLLIVTHFICPLIQHKLASTTDGLIFLKTGDLGNTYCIYIRPKEQHEGSGIKLSFRLSNWTKLENKLLSMA